MTFEDAKSAALLSHVVGQVESNIQFLLSQGYISQGDASIMLSKLPRASFPVPQPVNNQWAMPAPPPRPVAPPAPSPVYGKALWSYENKEDRTGEDISFKEGDMIEIVEETNEHWWTGRIYGKQGLFPANYVEKQTNVKEKAHYRPFGAAFHGMDAPPPSGTGVNSVGLQEADQSKKKSKFGGLGNTVAHSAAGGVGFGAGAAIGSGIVNAIF